MKAVVYDKWLTSFGGGEVVACNIARLLKIAGYRVIFITGKECSAQEVKNNLGIDFRGIKILEIWNDEMQLKKIVKDADLFVNTSFMDYSFGFAKKNIYYTHFPTRPDGDIWGTFINSFVLPLLTKFIRTQEVIDSVDASVIINKMPAYRIQKNNHIAFPFLTAGKQHKMEFSLYFESFSKTVLENISWSIDNAKVVNRQVSVDHRNNQIKYTITFLPETTTAYLRLEMKTPTSLSEVQDGVYLLYPKFTVNQIPSPLFKELQDRINTRLRAGIFRNLSKRLESYQVIMANSEFTKRWVHNYWKRESKVVNPPVEMLFDKYSLAKFKKKNWICSVGRFFVLGHSKRQDILIEAFKKLCDQGLTGWKLHLVGGVSPDPKTLQYVSYLKEQARGYPVVFHFSATREEVEQVYLNSKIYWHAAGFNSKGTKEPIKLEHFGITTVEAMSAGCVPVVINQGGQIEIIGNSDSGFLWDKTEELINYSTRLINDEPLMSRMSKQALIRSKLFEIENFRKNFLDSCTNIKNR
ncbi:MAG: hypothetical protein US86_C0001G0126 [Candidatus Daviesbacteria bacterium GW2011_GWA2_38_24]|uniref:Glycosyl transferase family 1 domain-containing protein n=1 Tax=Candidatus Daviesbacteria bacterium GW2011_GWA2_38_24 TaxID=1618422 RepID=A0A0G0M0N6_9BACT|nr:MAG: hypothetical protein US86_C0001G0126 [Candidatus Daviesbacteria bacterium GW2011_GWA2_38_24]KKQ81031.1 MAG: hypothetical protein UT01_C0001G0014 [Candidatus Daviesbacteria bacterium GW2011_GWA1_38_7]